MIALGEPGSGKILFVREGRKVKAGYRKLEKEKYKKLEGVGGGSLLLAQWQRLESSLKLQTAKC